MKKLLILTIVAMTAIPAHADNMITRFWDKSQPYAEIDIVKPLYNNWSKVFGSDREIMSSSGIELGAGLSNDWFELGFHHSNIFVNGGINYEYNMIKSKLKYTSEYKVTPFAGIGLGVGSFFEDRTNVNAFAYEISIGLDTKISDKVNFRPQIFYQSALVKGATGDFQDNLTEIGLKAGISFNF